MRYFNVNELNCWIAPERKDFGVDTRNKFTKAVIQYLPDGTEKRHPSIKEAAEAVGTSTPNIRKAAGPKYQQQFAAGFKWAYANQ